MPGKQDEKKPGAMATPAPSTFVAKTGSLAESAAAGSALTLVDGNAATAAASSWHWDEQDNESEGEYAEHPVAHGKQQKQVQARESFALDDSVDSVANAKSTGSSSWRFWGRPSDAILLLAPIHVPLEFHVHI